MKHSAFGVLHSKSMYPKEPKLQSHEVQRDLENWERKPKTNVLCYYEESFQIPSSVSSQKEHHKHCIYKTPARVVANIEIEREEGTCS